MPKHLSEIRWKFVSFKKCVLQWPSWRTNQRGLTSFTYRASTVPPLQSHSALSTQWSLQDAFSSHNRFRMPYMAPIITSNLTILGGWSMFVWATYNTNKIDIKHASVTELNLHVTGKIVTSHQLFIWNEIKDMEPRLEMYPASTNMQMLWQLHNKNISRAKLENCFTKFYCRCICFKLWN